MDVSATGILATLGGVTPPGAPRFQPPKRDEPPAAAVGKTETETQDQARSIADDVARDDEAKASTRERIEELKSLTQTRLSIRYDDDAQLFVSRSVDKGSGEVVHQYPPDNQIARIRLLIATIRDEFQSRVDVKA